MDNPGNAPGQELQPAAPQMPPLRTFVVTIYDPTEMKTEEVRHQGHLMTEKVSGSLWIVEVQMNPWTGTPIERIVKVYPTGEWDAAEEIYTPTSTIIH